MTHAEPAERTALLQGLRTLADYLESNPGIPVTSHATVYAFPPDGACAEMRAEIDSIAALLAVEAHETADDGSHYTAMRSFGPVEYRAVAICKHHHASKE
jgi:hypothetical protein